jgi:hypothetical protein
MARRFVAGIGQILLAVAGFAMIMGWFVLRMIALYQQINGVTGTKSVAWLGEAGALAFGAAWLWALVTSLSVLREAKMNETKANEAGQDAA